VFTPWHVVEDLVRIQQSWMTFGATSESMDAGILQQGKCSLVPEFSAPWTKQGPASYFPSIEQKYGKSISEWQKIIKNCEIEKHHAIVSYLKAEYGMGHGAWSRERLGWVDSRL
jgi:hypothetical protein